ncbi:MAG: thioredoxin [Clostridia bacterium]|nr:thioredoxin [Clostridia bacterium]
MSVLTITEENFEEEVLNSEKTVLIDFYADWCGPCKMQSPIIDKIAEERNDIKVGKVNVDQNSDLASKYGIMSIPTLVVIKNGEIASKFVGLTPKEKIEEIF